MKRTNADLRLVYDRAYANGNFFSIPSKEISDTILSSVEWGGKNVLEVGCGCGEMAHRITCSGANSILAIDYSLVGIKKAKLKFTQNNLLFRCKDLETVHGKFDVVVAQEVLEHVDDPFTVLKKFCGMADTVIVSCPNFLNPRGFVWMALAVLLDVPMSLTDVSYLAPFDFEEWAEKLGFGLRWHTIQHDHAFGKPMLKNMQQRLFSALADAGLPNERVVKFIEWFSRAVAFERKEKHNGVTAVYVLEKIYKD